MTVLGLRTLDGRPVVLGRRLGRGGEGVVHLIENAPGFAAKVYHAYDAGRAARLSASISREGCGVSPAVAWPRKLLCDRDGRRVGFIMEAFADGRPIHDLYTPLSRRTSFPGAAPAFMVRAALNLARVVSRLHRSGIIIGDLNHSSVLVLPDATVRLVDADSFPLPPGYTCPVGTPEYLPVSLQGVELSKVGRTRHSDAFALSVLVHQLLFDGRHPFAGYGGRPSPDVTVNMRRAKRFRLGARELQRLDVVAGSRCAGEVAGLLSELLSRGSKTDDGAHRWVLALSGAFRE